MQSDFESGLKTHRNGAAPRRCGHLVMLIWRDYSIAASSIVGR